VVEFIRQEFGVAYHKAHISRSLKALHWTPQLPVERASQRDEEAVRRRRYRSMAAVEKKAMKEGLIIVFIDEAGLPPARTGWRWLIHRSLSFKCNSQ